MAESSTMTERGSSADWHYDLGGYSRKVTTTSSEAQLWFDRGLLWTYAYNHEEAIVCFKNAIEIDPRCAMAHWGVAYAIGPNYNKGWDSFEDNEKPAALKIAHGATEIAAQVLDMATVTPVERALIQAIPKRYPEHEDDCGAASNDAFADAMRQVHQSFPNDLEVCCFFAEAIMNRTPWQLWDLKTGQPAAGAGTLEAIKVLETALDNVDGAWDHPGLLHMYIHLMEMSPNPERALRHGDRLVSLAHDAGHLLHMATHIDVLTGDYANVVARNHAAILADRKFLQRQGDDNFYTIYRCHNYHFKVYGALFLGQVSPALEAAQELIDTLSEDLIRKLPDWFESFVPMKQHVLVRFGRWQEILDQELPANSDLYSVTTATMRYARAVALANTGDLQGAMAEQVLFGQARDSVQASRMLFNNTARDILNVAQQMMCGEIEYRKGNHEAAFDHLRQAIHLDDNLPYDEPWGWMQPVRHALGALLLEQGYYTEAEQVYRADLGLDATLARACQHPGNVWSLHGLMECLQRRGETVESVQVQVQLDKALARAEVPIRASCLCRHK